jgi:enamine deaminase RidA (YjgF/YER057c/UK114 family)
VPDGTIPKGFEAQAKQTWQNIISILGAAGMGVEDLVKVNIFATSEALATAFSPGRCRSLTQFSCRSDPRPGADGNVTFVT